MAQEDILKREIDKMARALGNVLLKQVGIVTGNVTETVNYANEALKGELDLDLAKSALLLMMS